MKKLFYTALLFCGALTASADSALQIAPIATVANDDVSLTEKMLEFSIVGEPTKYNGIEATVYFPNELDPWTDSDIELGEGLPYTTGRGGSKTYSHKVEFNKSSVDKQDMPGYTRYRLLVYCSDTKHFTGESLFKIYCGTKDAADGYYSIILKDVKIGIDDRNSDITELESSYVKIGNPTASTLTLQGTVPTLTTEALATESAIATLNLSAVTAVNGDFTYVAGRKVVAPTSVAASVKFDAPLAGTYGSFCAPVDVNVDCYTLTSCDGTTAVFTPATTAPAGTPVLIDKPVKTAAQAARLTTVEGRQITAGYYVAANGSGMHSVNGTATIPALRGAWEDIAASSNLRIAIETPTGIQCIGTADEVFGNTYDLQGRQVQEAHNGVFVVNGKKQFVK